jgi:D-alanine--poly(phosphoribitol) ligase subunit 2
MMPKKEQIQKLIFEVIDEQNEQLSAQDHIKKSPDTILFGDEGVLDSIGLVNFIVSLEQKIQEEFGAFIPIADEKAVSQKNSPFRTVKTLVEYAALLIEKELNVK